VCDPYLLHICPGYVPDISGTYQTYIREIPAFAMAIPALGREVDRDYLNIKTRSLWRSKSQTLGFTGSLHNISAYKGGDMDTIIIRYKGGPSKRMIKSHPSFELTRRNNKEFGGRSTASEWIMRVLHPLKPLSDYNISGPLNSTLKPIQEMDTVSGPGKKKHRAFQKPTPAGRLSAQSQESF
jgi:hypothetical protein